MPSRVPFSLTTRSGHGGPGPAGTPAAATADVDGAGPDNLSATELAWQASITCGRSRQ